MTRMLVLGLLLLAATAAFTGLAIADNLGGGPEYSVSVLGNHIATMNALELFCAGLTLALLFCLGMATALNSAHRSRRRHRRARGYGRGDDTRAFDEPMGPDGRHA
jgi:hypothetical protein